MPGRSIGQILHGITPYLIILLCFTTLGPLQFGYHLAELNAPQDVITCHKKSISTAVRVVSWINEAIRTSDKNHDGKSGFLQECIPMSEAAFATISSMFTVGGLIGALVAGPLASKKGRLFAMMFTSLMYAIGSATESISSSVVAMCFGRLFSGLGAGASTVIVPLYISEIAPPAERGLFGAMTQISINIGIIVTQTLGYFLSYGKAWRFIFSIGACISFVQGVGFFVVPESPAWLAAHGDPAKAKRILQRIRGTGFDIQEETLHWGDDGATLAREPEEEVLLTRPDGAIPPSFSSFSTTRHMGFVEVLTDLNTRPAIIAVVGIMVTQQFCGINSIIMYSVSLLADLLPISSALLTIIISAVNLVMTIACAPLPDRLGRKTCLLISILGQGSSSLALAFSILFGVKVLSAIAVLFFVAFFAVGLGPVPFIMASELVSQEAVGATQSWCLAANYVATFVVAQFFPIINTALNKALGKAGWVYFLFSVLAALGAVFVSANVPETKGKRDVDEVWGRTRRLD
ncbi:Bifunctional purine biosynthesis protein PurH [Conoideocrella luteorostrata]|uniref:Bifunctional purine biosynthesis protein PurH n=1 Tax=Conoideocrella luteorostrata TaxID=1105319 RepID=A0AAJ0CC71_9HYPO|nr:Bifunctional purine biosynthesis protein PurH [Conoideocrella luteorostrata]